MTRFRSDLAVAVREGRIAVDAAALFTSTLAALFSAVASSGRTAPSGHADPAAGAVAHGETSPAGDGAPLDTERTRRLFTQALEKASGLPLHKVRKLVWQAQAFADPGAWAEREERQHEARSLTVRDDADGMVTVQPG